MFAGVMICVTTAWYWFNKTIYIKQQFNKFVIKKLMIDLTSDLKFDLQP